MNSTLLISFGCSWTYGVGVGWQGSMTNQQYKDIAWDPATCDQLSFRGLLAERYQLDNLNFSVGASSNQAQFRLAREYFGSKLYQQHQHKYKKILVLWGITSTARNEFYFVNYNARQNVMYNESTALSKLMLTEHYDHAHEVEQLASEIQFWNLFFEQNNVDVVWFDTFNHHDYPSDNRLADDYQSVAGPDWPSWNNYLYHTNTVDPVVLKEINDTTQWNFAQYKPVDFKFLYNNTTPRDLLSQLAIHAGWQVADDQYHLSDWAVDTQRIELLKKHNLVNPITLHPTQQGHQQISKMFHSWFDLRQPLA